LVGLVADIYAHCVGHGAATHDQWPHL